MPIVFVHGVAVRQDPPYPEDTATFLRAIIAPVLAKDDPGGVKIIHANWFDSTANFNKFAWGGRSIPARRAEGSVLGDEVAAPSPTAPPERAIVTAQLIESLQGVPDTSDSGLLLGGTSPATPV